MVTKRTPTPSTPKKGASLHERGNMGSEKARHTHSKRNIASATPHTKNSTARPASHEIHAVSDKKSTKDLLVTRRQLLFGAAGAVAVVGVGIAASQYIDLREDTSQVETLKVPASATFDLESATLVEDASSMLVNTGNFDLTYGSMLWANTDTLAACLLPTETAHPLTQVALLNLETGNMYTVLEQAASHAEGFDIYDVRASEASIIWTEANLLTQMWRTWCAPVIDGASIGDPHLLEESDNNWDIPSLAAVGNKVFWQMLPNTQGNASTENSRLMQAEIANPTPSLVLASEGRMATPLYADSAHLVVSPRLQAQNVYYELTYLDAQTSEVLDTLVLPQSMRPLEAAYGKSGFMFSFDNLYTSNDGLSNIGTYFPKVSTKPADYNNTQWFVFGRTPTAAPCWCGNTAVVKSRTSICPVNPDTGEYAAIDVESGADDWGEYLASSGMRNKILTYTNIDYTALDGKTTKKCLARTWRSATA